MAGYQTNNRGDLTDASNMANILRPTTLDQLPEHLCKDVEAKDAANVAAALAAYSFKSRSSKVAKQDKTINLQVFTFKGTYISSSRASPLVSEPPACLFTSEQFKWMEEQLEAGEAKIINQMNTIEHNASLKKPIESEIAIYT
jgi:peptidyl-tRNA hydrolase